MINVMTPYNMSQNLMISVDYLVGLISTPLSVVTTSLGGSKKHRETIIAGLTCI